MPEQSQNLGVNVLKQSQNHDDFNDPMSPMTPMNMAKRKAFFDSDSDNSIFQDPSNERNPGPTFPKSKGTEKRKHSTSSDSESGFKDPLSVFTKFGAKLKPKKKKK